LAGARTPTQVEENAGAAAHALSPDLLAEIDAIVGDVYRPRALRAGVAVAAAPNAAGEYVVTRARAAGPLAVGEREAYVMRRLDGRTPYDEIASAWRPADGRRLLTAQVVL